MSKSTVKFVKPQVACWCGCGGLTKSRFVPGHDARFAGLAKRVARGEASHDDAVASLPHAEAVAHFEEHVAHERPLHAAREAVREAEATAKAKAKADAKAAKEDAAKAADQTPTQGIVADNASTTDATADQTADTQHQAA